MIRKVSMGWDDGMDSGVTPGFWDGRSLGQEPAVSLCSTWTPVRGTCEIPADEEEYESYDGSAFVQTSDPHRSVHASAL